MDALLSQISSSPFINLKRRPLSHRGVVARPSDSHISNEIWERALRAGRSMPALVLRNDSEIEIYGAGSVVSPINDRVVYISREQWGFILGTRA